MEAYKDKNTELRAKATPSYGENLRRNISKDINGKQMETVRKRGRKKLEITMKVV